MISNVHFWFCILPQNHEFFFLLLKTKDLLSLIFFLIYAFEEDEVVASSHMGPWNKYNGMAWKEWNLKVKKN